MDVKRRLLDVQRRLTAVKRRFMDVKKEVTGCKMRFMDQKRRLMDVGKEKQKGDVILRSENCLALCYD